MHSMLRRQGVEEATARALACAIELVYRRMYRALRWTMHRMLSQYIPSNVATQEDIHELKQEIRSELKLLIEMFNQRFEDMNKRFEHINQRFEDVNKRFEDVNKRFEDMNRRFEEMLYYMDRRFEEMNRRFRMLQWWITIAWAIFSLLVSFLFWFFR